MVRGVDGSQPVLVGAAGEGYRRLPGTFRESDLAGCAPTLSPDGRQVAWVDCTRSPGAVLVVLRLEAGSVRRIPLAGQGTGIQASALAWSQDGGQVAVALADGSFVDGRGSLVGGAVTIVSVSSGRVSLWPAPHPTVLGSLAFSANGRLATVDAQGLIRIHDAAGTVLATHQATHRFDERVWWGADGGAVEWVSPDLRIVRWEPGSAGETLGTPLAASGTVFGAYQGTYLLRESTAAYYVLSTVDATGRRALLTRLVGGIDLVGAAADTLPS